jgi:hypothetical protein
MMKKVSDVFKSIRYAKLDPNHDKGPKGSTDDEEHYTISSKEYGQQLDHAKKRAMMTTEAKEKTEYDYEGDMARGQLQSIINNAQRVHDMLEDNDNLPEWVQSKITLAEDYISTVSNYMMSEIDEETMSHQAKTTMKHIPNASPALKKAAKDIKPGVGGYRDRIAMLKAGGVKEEVEELDELSNDMLGRYKTAAGADASKADKAGDYNKGNKRFGGIVKATKKQFSNDMKKEEVVQEGRPSQRHPLEGHEYHKKTNAELEYIAKDAHKAAEAMKSHNTTAENKYRDQANDSATVRHFRKTSGTPDWYKKKYGHMKEGTVNEVMDEPKYSLSIQARQKKADDANKPPFDGPYTKTSPVTTDKSGAKHGPMSVAKHLAKQAMQRQSASLKKPVKEQAMSNKAKIVKDAAKKKKTGESEDAFQSEPIMTKSPTKNY